VSVPTRVTPAVALACLLVLGATAPALAFTPAPTGTGTTEPRILAAYPNPVTDGDAGRPLPVGLLVAVVVGALVALVAASRLEVT
jgi:multisubunit Na+/H+ antiporter MnhB subunit